MTERDTTHDAGVAPAAPASPSAPAEPDVVPPSARAELGRIRRRWVELPQSRALVAAPVLRAAVEDAARRTHGTASVSDLGPAPLPDQLTVVVWDAYVAGRGEGLAAALTALRRALP